MLAGLALLVLLASVGAVAVWRTQNERNARAALERRALALDALEVQRGQVFLIGTYTAMSSLAEDPTYFLEQYDQVAEGARQSLQRAHDALAATGDDTPALDAMQADAAKMLDAADAVMAPFAGMDRGQRLEASQEAMNALWPNAAPLVATLQQFLDEQQAKLFSERQTADAASEKGLALLIGLSCISFLVACGILATFISSLVRPLASLRASARAIISGDLAARANESGPEELASVARDVNNMTQALLDRTERMVKSEQRFRDVLEISRDVVYKVNIETQTYDYISPSASELLDFTPEELIEMGLRGTQARVHPEDVTAFGFSDSGAQRQEAGRREATSAEYRWRFRDGSYHWLSDDRTVVRDDEGKVLALVGTVRDITQRKAADEALRESEEKFRSLSASAPVGIFSVDTNAKFTYANQQLLDDFGLQSEEVLGRFWGWNIHPDDRETAVDEGMAAGREGRKFSAEYRIVRPDGGIRWIRTVSEPVLDKNGNAVSFVGAAEDITERRRAEDALRESEERFRTLSASAPIGIFLMDDKGEIVYVNERLRTISGAPKQGGAMSELVLAVHADDRQQLLEEWAKAGDHGELSAEYRILTPDGQTRWIHMHVSRLASSGAHEGGVVGTVEDITRQKTSEEEMGHRIQMESAVSRASSLLAGSKDVHTSLNMAMRILGEAFDAQRAHIFVLDGKTRMHCIGEWCSPDAFEARNLYDFDAVAFPWSTRKMLQAEPVVVDDISTLPPEAAAEKSLWESMDIQSIVAVPLVSDGRITGAVILDRTTTTCMWREEDVRLLRLVAESISSFIDRQRAGEETRQAYESIIFLLATAAEARDPYTEHHLQRVRGYTRSIALEVGLAPEQAQEIGLVALLHDLGKIRVPDSILIKPGPLTEKEWQVMRKHTIWGEQMLPDDPWFKTAREIARWHHESWDGTGYPDGLHGDMIPVYTAIVAVADGFDAMTSRRPYKEPWPPVRAIREITRQRGKRYSPIVVDAFLRAIDKGEIDQIIVSPRAKKPGLRKAA